MKYMNIAKHRCMHYLSMNCFWNQLHCYYIPFDSFKIKITNKTRTQIIQKDSKGNLYCIQSLVGYVY
jgi:hypothetical protein